jgi:uncharacterized damage-inducible protein DinB
MAPLEAGEREMLTAWLDFHRATLACKCDGLTDDQMRDRSVPASALTLLGLVRHMAETERGWFRQIFAGEDVADLYCTPEDPEADFHGGQTGSVPEAVAAWQAECAAARTAVDAAGSLDALARRPTRRGTASLRWILVHMIEEYARHNGHADLLRESIDGSAGD